MHRHRLLKSLAAAHRYPIQHQVFDKSLRCLPIGYTRTSAAYRAAFSGRGALCIVHPGLPMDDMSVMDRLAAAGEGIMAEPEVTIFDDDVEVPTVIFVLAGGEGSSPPFKATASSLTDM